MLLKRRRIMLCKIQAKESLQLWKRDVQAGSIQIQALGSKNSIQLEPQASPRGVIEEAERIFREFNA